MTSLGDARGDVGLEHGRKQCGRPAFESRRADVPYVSDPDRSGLLRATSDRSATDAEARRNRSA